MAIYAAGAETYDDPGFYADDIIRASISDPEARTTALDYVRQALAFREDNLGFFENEYLSDLADIVPYLSGGNESDLVTRIWELLKRHGDAVHTGVRRMRELNDDPFKPLVPRSLLGLLAVREHLKPEVARAVQSIVDIAESALHEMFSQAPPDNESDLNMKLAALLRTHQPELRSEHPTVSFACARVVPDHELKSHALLIEAKYIRGGTPPSKANEGIAADLTKYPDTSHILFLVYDPLAAILRDRDFRQDFERKGRCTVRIVR